MVTSLLTDVPAGTELVMNYDSELVCEVNSSGTVCGDSPVEQVAKRPKIEQVRIDEQLFGPDALENLHNVYREQVQIHVEIHDDSKNKSRAHGRLLHFAELPTVTMQSLWDQIQQTIRAEYLAPGTIANLDLYDMGPDVDEPWLLIDPTQDTLAMRGWIGGDERYIRGVLTHKLMQNHSSPKEQNHDRDDDQHDHDQGWKQIRQLSLTSRTKECPWC